MPDFEITPGSSLTEKIAEMRLRFSEITVGQVVGIYAREDKPFDPKAVAEERRGQPTPPIGEPRTLPVAPMKKIHEGKVTEKTDTYVSIGGITVLRKDIESGTVSVQRAAKNPLADTHRRTSGR